MKKKAQVNQIFVMVFSVLVIVFGVFLVVKFVGAMNNDVSNRILLDTLTEFELDYTSVRNEFNSEAIHTYRIPGAVDEINFITPHCNTITETYVESFSNGYFVVLLDDSGQVLEFREIEEFNKDIDECIVIEDPELINIAYINQRNQIIIQHIQ